jgi:transcriptional regulator with XRE-family HTH domain
VRVKRRWRQSDLAAAAGTSTATISRIERGHLDSCSWRTLRRVGDALDIRLQIVPRWRAGDLDRLLNARHSALHESVARRLARRRAWTFIPEVSFSIYGERGVIDLFGWHGSSRTVLVVELKTEVVDVQEVLGTLDRKRRLAPRIAAEHGWRPVTVSAWLIIEDSTTNRRRAAAHRALLRSALPDDGRSIQGWLRTPTGSVACLSFWSDSHLVNARRQSTAARRVRPPNQASRESRSSVGSGGYGE